MMSLAIRRKIENPKKEYMRLYATPPLLIEETGHFIIDTPSKPAHKEILSTTSIYIIEEENGAFRMNSYNLKGNWLGDTWHQTIQDAKDQAIFEYNAFGKPLDKWDWKEIPEHALDPLKFVLTQLKRTVE